MGIDKMLAIEVDHCQHSYACLLQGSSKEFGEGQRIVYSGDTRPCQNLKNYAQGCQLLIHEATFTDEFGKHAR